MFVFIGQAPRTDWLGDLVERDATGFVLTGADLVRVGDHPKGWPLGARAIHARDEIPGIFCAGDVRLNSTKRIASAVGEGCHGGQVRPPASRRPVTQRSMSCTEADRELLRRVPMFAELTEEDLSWVADAGEPIELSGGDQLAGEGEAGDALYVVISGELEVVKRSRTTDIPLALLGPGRDRRRDGDLRGPAADGLGAGHHPDEGDPDRAGRGPRAGQHAAVGDACRSCGP